MPRLLCSILVLLVPVLAACHTPYAPVEDRHTITQTRATGPLEGRPTLGMPIRIPGRTTLLVPFAVESEKAWYQDSDPYTKGGYAASPRPGRFGASARWHNVMVYDSATGEQWPILDRRGVVSRFEFLGNPPDEKHPFVSDAVGFLATIEDTNKDGVLNDLDASVMILCGADGRDPRIVSPAGAQVWASNYDHELRQVFFLVVADTNKDGKFDTDDAPVPYVVAIGSNEAGRPAISEASRGRLDAMLK